VVTAGEARTSAIDIRSWHDGNVELSTDLDGLAALVAVEGSRTWIDLTYPTPEQVQSAASQLGLHPLVAEDIIESNERAKVQLIDDVIHVVSFVLEREPGGDEVESHEVDFVLGRGFLLSVHPAIWDPNTPHQVRMSVASLLERGPDFMLWALVDAIVDGYFPVFDRLGDEIDEVQDAAVAKPTAETLEHVFRLKRELIRIRHVLAPGREVFAQLTSREFDLIAEQNVFYFRDVYDHLIRLNDELDSFRELVAGSREINISTINNNHSKIMKRHTGVTVNLAGIGAIGGLFGMSEAGSALAGGEASGFYLIAGATIAAAIGAGFLLRRIDWL
jgi:magnesium transporter